MLRLPNLAQPPKVDPCISPEGQGGGVAGQGAVPGELESPGWGQGYAPCHQCSPAPFPGLWGLLPPILMPGPDLCTPPPLLPPPLLVSKHPTEGCLGAGETQAWPLQSWGQAQPVGLKEVTR